MNEFFFLVAYLLICTKKRERKKCKIKCYNIRYTVVNGKKYRTDNSNFFMKIDIKILICLLFPHLKIIKISYLKDYKIVKFDTRKNANNFLLSLLVVYKKQIKIQRMRFIFLHCIKNTNVIQISSSMRTLHRHF
jgi:hypothetical protein